MRSIPNGWFAPINWVTPPQLKETSDQGASNTGLTIHNHTAHPNAEKVYLNWLLSGDGHTDLVHSTGYLSTRLDVPTDVGPAWEIPQPGAIKAYDQAALDARSKVQDLVNPVFGAS